MTSNFQSVPETIANGVAYYDGTPLIQNDDQKELLRKIHGHDIVYGKMARRAGKTSTALAYLSWFKVTYPDAAILVLAPRTKEVGVKLADLGIDIYDSSKTDRHTKPVFLADTQTYDRTCQTRHGLFGPSQNRRVLWDLVYVDEYAYFRESMDVLRLQESYGKLVVLSTPNGKDPFFDNWTELNQCDEISIHNEVRSVATHVTRATVPACLRAQRYGLTQEQFIQEYKARFVID